MELAERFKQVIAVHPRLDLLGVALFDVERATTRVEVEARRMVSETIGSGDVVFHSSVRHSISVAQQSRRYGKLVHELDEFAQKQPEWWRIRRGEASGERVSRTASSVADDLYSLTKEIMERLGEREDEVASR